MNKQIGKLSKQVISLLDLSYQEGQPIILGEANIEHMQRQHPEDYIKYGKDIETKINIYLKNGYAKKLR